MRIAFVVEPGRLEMLGAILAISIRQAYGKAITICVGAPALSIERWAPQTREILKELGCELLTFDNPYRASYPISNKILLTRSLPKTNGSSVFIDTDMLMLRPSHRLQRPDGGLLLPGRFQKAMGRAAWIDLLARFELCMPTDSTFYRKSNLVAWTADSELAVIWHQVFEKVWALMETGDVVLRRRRQMDQVSITIASMLLTPQESFQLSTRGELFRGGLRGDPRLICIAPRASRMQGKALPAITGFQNHRLTGKNHLERHIISCVTEWAEQYSLKQHPGWQDFAAQHLSRRSMRSHHEAYMRDHEEGNS